MGRETSDECFCGVLRTSGGQGTRNQHMGPRGGFPAQPGMAVVSRLATRPSRTVGHILPSRSPCRLFLCLSARPHPEAAWTAQAGWGTPGGRGLCRTRGRRTSTLEKHGTRLRPAAPKQRPRGTRAHPQRGRLPDTRGRGCRVTSAHTHAPARGRHTTRSRKALVMTDPGEQTHTAALLSRRLGSEIF